MAPTYKLIYFDTPGAAEPIRYIFAYANQEYEDLRIKQDDWPSIKPTTPFGKVPILEINGKPIAQSHAIARYLAKQFSLAGKNDWESLQCDVMVDTYKDLTQSLVKIYYENDPQKKEEMKKEFHEKELPFYYEKFNKIVADNPHGVLVGSQITWADLMLATGMDLLETAKPGILKPYPALEGLLQKVNSSPGIKSWLKNRPPNTNTFKL